MTPNGDHLTSLSRPLIKVCGVTRADDLLDLSRAGVNAVGLNFVPTSPRRIDFATGSRLAAIARELGLASVAVVRNPPPSTLVELLDRVEFDLLQLHGDESPALLDQASFDTRRPALGIIKAISWSGRDEELHIVEAWRGYAQRPKARLVAWLVDAFAPDAGGGTGRLANWDLLVPRPAVLGDVPLILAGGLGPQNVATAIRQVGPQGVDTASGVEESPGLKSASLVVAFAQAALEGFATDPTQHC